MSEFPWSVDTREHHEGEIRDADGNTIIQCCGPNPNWHQDISNATLIVAACNAWGDPKTLRARITEIESAADR